MITIEVVSERLPGSKNKLQKPAQLKGVQPFCSYKWGGCTACQAFEKDGDLWIKHNDWCSKFIPKEEAIKMGAKVKHAYTYDDAFGGLVIKGQAWIVLRGVFKISPARAINMVYQACMDDLYSSRRRFCCDDERMFVDLITRYAATQEREYW